MSVIEFLQGFFGEGWLGFFLVVTQLGGKGSFLVLGSLYYWLVSPRQGRQLVLTLILSVLSNVLLKNAFALPRPYVINPAVTTPEASQTLGSFSFPSGHAQGITTFWGMVACLQRKVWLWGVAIAVIVLVCVSRMYLGVHFPVDVAVGMLLGIVWIVAGLWAGREEALPNYQLGQKIGFWLVGGLAAIAVPSLSGLVGLFCGFFPLPTVPFTPPQPPRDRLMLGSGGLVIVVSSYLLLHELSEMLPDVALVDYGRYLAIALIVTEVIPWLWHRLQTVR